MEKNKTRELSQMAILTAILFMGQVVLSFLPNVEIVSLLIILYTLFLRKNVFFVIYSFVFLEGFLYDRSGGSAYGGSATCTYGAF